MTSLAPALAELITDRLPPLDAGKPEGALRSRLESLRPETIGGPKMADRQMALCCISGLWLWHNFLDESHSLSQEIETREGSYWHGIMHRREPDFGNAKYWYRRVGQHQIFPALSRAVQEHLSGETLSNQLAFLAAGREWDPYRFIDCCEEALERRNGAVDLCRRVAALEWRLLFDYCHQAARG